VEIRGYKSSFTYKITQSGLISFSCVADLFAKDDLTIANCEVRLTDPPWARTASSWP
jgi:hypothetical protein